MISKELLSTILDHEIDGLVPYNKGESFVEYTQHPINSDDGIWEIINIHVLSYRCREWSNSKGYEIIVRKTDFDIPFNFVINEHWDCDNSGSAPYSVSDHEDYAETDPEAYIQACEWVLKEIQKEENK